MVTSVQSTSNNVSQALLDNVNGTKSKADTTQEAQDRFMTLLVTQMKNQDPLNPMDNAQVTSQMAQLSTVTVSYTHLDVYKRQALDIYLRA